MSSLCDEGPTRVVERGGQRLNLRPEDIIQYNRPGKRPKNSEDEKDQISHP